MQVLLAGHVFGGYHCGVCVQVRAWRGICQSDTEQPDAEKGIAITTSNSSSNAAARPPGGLSSRTLLVDA